MPEMLGCYFYMQIFKVFAQNGNKGEIYATQHPHLENRHFPSPPLPTVVALRSRFRGFHYLVAYHGVFNEFSRVLLCA